LANFFIGDPNLQQVGSHTIETGLRSEQPDPGARVFQNVGTTRRQVVDASAQPRTDKLLARIAYSYIAATFQTGFAESSGNNLCADANGNIHVQPATTCLLSPATSGRSMSTIR
jgi:hypothetical protein